MDLSVLFALLLSVLPVIEIRGSIPLLIEYGYRTGNPYWYYIIIALALNFLVISFVFLFFDYVNQKLVGWKTYRTVVEKWLKRVHRKAGKINPETQYLSLFLVVALPVPGTGAWMGTFIAWILGLNRVKSFLSIALGVIASGIFFALASLGIFSLFG